MLGIFSFRFVQTLSRHQEFTLRLFCPLDGMARFSLSSHVTNRTNFMDIGSRSPTKLGWLQQNDLSSHASIL